MLIGDVVIWKRYDDGPEVIRLTETDPGNKQSRVGKNYTQLLGDRRPLGDVQIRPNDLLLLPLRRTEPAKNFIHQWITVEAIIDEAVVWKSRSTDGGSLQRRQ